MKKSFRNESQMMGWVRSETTGRIVCELDPSIGDGSISVQRVAPMCLISLVDFTCERCPNMSSNSLGMDRGKWFTVNYCLEGRCEVDAGRQGFAVVKAGDCCVSCAESWPEEFRYPLGIYRGVELWVNTELAHDRSFGLLGQASISLEAIAKDAGLAAVFNNDDALNDPLRRMKDLLEDSGIPEEKAIAGCTIELMRFFFALSERDVAAARPISLLSPNQMQIVKRLSQRMRANLLDMHDARVLAKEIGVSTSTLNNWFVSLYGLTVSAYLRHQRIDKAAAMLAQGMHVADVSLAVGYVNPSKFAAAFKRERGVLPSEFRRGALPPVR